MKWGLYNIDVRWMVCTLTLAAWHCSSGEDVRQGQSIERCRIRNECHNSLIHRLGITLFSLLPSPTSNLPSSIYRSRKWSAPDDARSLSEGNKQARHHRGDRLPRRPSAERAILQNPMHLLPTVPEPLIAVFLPSSNNGQGIYRKHTDQVLPVITRTPFPPHNHFRRFRSRGNQEQDQNKTRAADAKLLFRSRSSFAYRKLGADGGICPSSRAHKR